MENDRIEFFFQTAQNSNLLNSELCRDQITVNENKLRCDTFSEDADFRIPGTFKVIFSFCKVWIEPISIYHSVGFN